MKRYSPGASEKSDYYYICDCCEIDDGRPVLLWKTLPQRKGHFALCYECLGQLYIGYVSHIEKATETIIVKRLSIPETLRNRIFKRDGFKCVKCGVTTDLQIDHIVPFSKGGQTTEDNLQTLCQGCNTQKGQR